MGEAVTAFASKGTKLQLEIATVFTDIIQVVSIDGPGPDVETFDARHLGSGTGVPMLPNGYVAGGSVSAEMFLDPAAATTLALTALLTTPAVVNWKEIFSDTAATEWPFAGILKSFNPSAKPEDGLKATMEIMLSGIVTYPTS